MPRKGVSPITRRDWLYPREAIKILEVSERTLFEWVKKGVLKCWKTLGGHHRFSKAEVHELAIHVQRRRGEGRKKSLYTDKDII